MPQGQKRKRAEVRSSQPSKKRISTTKNHRFETFTQRIARIRIDPIRRSDERPIDDSDLSLTTSHFKACLDEWSERNLSDKFVQFVRLVAPLSDSLVQILHHKDRICELLLEFLEKRDKESLQPLLLLIPQFARDLGTRFEEYVEHTVKSVCSVAATHSDVEVTEWSFNCLAWLFKCLSRLLVPDLRPIYKLIKPIMGSGNEKQRPHIMRFAAEAMSFLLRKSADRCKKDQESLRAILEFILGDLALNTENRQNEDYQDAVVVMLVSAMSSAKKEELHSCAEILFHELIQAVLRVQEPEGQLVGSQIVNKVLNDVANRANAATLEPLYKSILQRSTKSGNLVTSTGEQLKLDLVLLLVNLREGRFIADWTTITTYVQELMDNMGRNAVGHAKDPGHWRLQVLSLLAVVHQRSPLNIAVGCTSLIEGSIQASFAPQFLEFCVLHAKLGAQRFSDLILPFLQRFIIQHWQDYQDRLALTIVELQKLGVITAKLHIPKSWQSTILAEFDHLHHQDEISPESRIWRCNLQLSLLQAISPEDDVQATLSSSLVSLLEESLSKPFAFDNLSREIFLTGQAFHFLAEHEDLCNKHRIGRSLLQRFQTTLNQMPAYWRSVLKCCHTGLLRDLNLSQPEGEGFLQALQSCLSSPSHELRLTALEILRTIQQNANDQETGLLDLAISIEKLEPSLHSAREIQMLLRRLVVTFKQGALSPWAVHGITAFCFGLQHITLSQAWDDAAAAIKEFCQNPFAETVACTIAFEWIVWPSHCSAGQNTAPLDDSPNISPHINYNVDAAMEEHFKEYHPSVALGSDANRNKSLRILSKIPLAAERRSRNLVPVLLDWAGADANADDVDEPRDGSDSSDSTVKAIVPSIRWTRKDQKALLNLFALFQNPKALFKSDEVYAALLALLCHGDSEIQKSALKAILAWRNPVLRKYEGDLMKFLDEARLKDQMTIFLNIGGGDDSLAEEDRDTVLPIVLRLLYGNAITRGRGEQKPIRRAIFRLLARLHKSEAEVFIEIVLGPLSRLNLVQEGQFVQRQLEVEVLSVRKQFGVLNMLKDMLETLDNTAQPFIEQLVDSVVYCLLYNEFTETIAAGEIEKDPKFGQLRSVRQLATQLVARLFTIAPGFPWSPYIQPLCARILRPRLQSFALENSQGVSGLLRVFAAWSSDPALVPFFDICGLGTLVSVVQCVSHPLAKETVKSYALRNILSPLLDQCQLSKKEAASKDILTRNAEEIVHELALALKSDISRDLLEDLTANLVRLAELSSVSNAELLQTATSLLTQPAKRVSTRTKSNLLGIILNAIPHQTWDDCLSDDVCTPISSSFAFFGDRENRRLLCEVVKELTKAGQISRQAAELCVDLNSWSSRKVDEPDFERRSQAFYNINETRHDDFALRDWELLANNMMHFITDEEELAIRTSASQSLRRFIDVACNQDEVDSSQYLKAIDSIVLAGIERGVKIRPEIVRSEYLMVLGYAVEKLPKHPRLLGLRPLQSSDEEASFFLNILHIQQHRRLRALKRLADIASHEEVSSNGLAHFVVPLLERFALEQNDGNLAAESCRTIAMVSGSLDWPQFSTLLRRYINMIQKEEERQESVLRLIDGLTSTLAHAVEMRAELPFHEAISGVKAALDNKSSNTSVLMRSLPKGGKLEQHVATVVLPPLTKFLHVKEESVVSKRIAVAIVVVRLIRHLPGDEFQFRFTALLADICNILRSKDQGARDATRKALSTICAMVGPPSVGFVIKELRRVLIHGFYLHVLSFSVHSILESVVGDFQLGDLDYCLHDVVAVVMEDIFGNVGQEKNAAEYMKDKADKREVRGKKSFDTLQLLARITSLPHLIELVRPIETLLMENLNHKMLHDIDELLRRTELGLLTNQGVKDRDILVFCYELIQDAYRVADGTKGNSGVAEKNSAVSKFVVRKVRNLPSDGLSKMAKMGKIIRFAFEIIRNTVRKQRDLATASNIAGFMPIMGDAVVSSQEEIKLAAVRLFTTIVTIPLPRIEEDAAVYVAEAAKVIEERHDSDDEMMHACLKLISTVLRERKEIPIKDRTVATLLKRLKPDLQNLNQQSSAFTLIRSIIGRKIVIPEVYELIDGDDGIAAMSVRDHDRSTRDLARGVYFQFLMEYPQARGRFAKQLTFIVRNLQYEHAEGRQSVMETINLLLNKVGDELVDQVVKEVFWPLVTSMVNDDSRMCREMAARLVKACFERADETWIQNFLTLFQRLLQDQTTSVQKRTALQCWALYLETRGEDAKLANNVIIKLSEFLEISNSASEDWQLVFYSLHTLTTLCPIQPKFALGQTTPDLWSAVRDKIVFPHAWVKAEAAKVIGLYLADFASTNKGEFAILPLRGSQGLQLSQIELCHLAFAHLYLLRNATNEETASQAVKNLAFLGRCFAASQCTWLPPSLQVGNEDPDMDHSQENEEFKDEAEGLNDAIEHKTALSHLLETSTLILARESNRRSPNADPNDLFVRRAESLIPRQSSLQLLAILINTLDQSAYLPCLDSILLPLLHLTDPTTTAPSSSDPAYKTAYDALVTNATELLDLLQKKLGTTEYVAAIQRVKRSVAARREERRQKRRIDAVTRPEVYEKGKARKREREKVKRKQKAELSRGQRRGW